MGRDTGRGRRRKQLLVGKEEKAHRPSQQRILVCDTSSRRAAEGKV